MASKFFLLAKVETSYDIICINYYTGDIVLVLFTAFTLLMYILFSTIFHNFDLVGVIGKNIGIWNIKIFGYVAYINFLFILIPMYSFFINPKLKYKIDAYVGWILLLISILIFQVLVLGERNSGIISAILHKSLVPYIGTAGLWFLFFLTLILSTTLITKKDITEIFYMINLNSIMDKIHTLNEDIADKIGRIFSAKDIPILDNFSKQESNSSSKHTVQPSKKKQVTTKHKTATNTTEANTTEASKKTPKTPPASTEEKINSSKKTENTVELKESKTVILNELEENKKLLEQLDKGEVEKPKNFKLPKLEFLEKPKKSTTRVNEAEIDRKIRELLEKLRLFKIDGDVVNTYTGPVVTTFEFKPAPHVKVSKILNLQDDLAMALSAETIRIQAPIPGRDVVGIEIPNDNFETIYLREILESKTFKETKSPLAVALGKDIVGKPFITDIKKLPHLLIAGTTGSGKSVGINAMLLSLLYRNGPDNLKLILIDPKMLEFSIYNDIPHLLTPVIIEPKKAIIALANLVKEMERRYQLMAQNKVKNIDNYNNKAKKEGLEHMPFIVVVIDELADLMMTGGKEVEYSIARLAQMARAAGIHIIVATQRPSVDVVTGLIKANLPARLSYRVGQKIDSKVILDTMGAESLLGRGDALFTPPGMTGLVRIHAPWNSEDEIEKIVEFLKAQQEPEYDDSYFKSGSDDDEVVNGAIELDPLYEDAKEVVLSDRKSSISYLQRKLQIGYNRAANIVEQLEKMGVLSAPNNKGNRDILI